MAQQTDHIGDTNKMVTAVEWLIDKVEDHFCLLPVDLIEQAKQMEKEQLLSLIRFMRINDKMGKSVEDLYQEFKKTYAE